MHLARKILLAAMADEEPPGAFAEQLLYPFQHHNIRGRFYYASLNYGFK